MKGVTKQTLGTKLRRLREEVHMEQEIVSKVLDIPRSAVSAIESGTRDISVMEFIELCKLYRISPNDLLSWPKYQTRKGSDSLDQT